MGFEHEFAAWARGETWGIDLLIGEATLLGRVYGPQVIEAFMALIRIPLNPEPSEKAGRRYTGAALPKKAPDVSPYRETRISFRLPFLGRTDALEDACPLGWISPVLRTDSIGIRMTRRKYRIERFLIAPADSNLRAIRAYWKACFGVLAEVGGLTLMKLDVAGPNL